MTKIDKVKSTRENYTNTDFCRSECEFWLIWNNTDWSRRQRSILVLQVNKNSNSLIQKSVIVYYTIMLYDVTGVIQWILLPAGEYHNLLTSRFYLAKEWIFLVLFLLLCVCTNLCNLFFFILKWLHLFRNLLKSLIFFSFNSLWSFQSHHTFLKFTVSFLVNRWLNI